MKKHFEKKSRTQSKLDKYCSCFCVDVLGHYNALIRMTKIAAKITEIFILKLLFNVKDYIKIIWKDYRKHSVRTQLLKIFLDYPR